ncbi:MAG: S-methyl-5-thioribose-1-phosphate isomerase [Candidatus Omnitrophota bacterium]|nr:MAG: S-methyl-5-thioribose-1-phosphate isomerase [Candidatus Omnitrophota bacterium]
MNAIKFKNNCLFYLDQTQLPSKEVWRQCKNLREGFTAIKQLRVRGAPLIGVFAAYCMAQALANFSHHKEQFLRQFKKGVRYLKQSRPTAVNLFWALDRLERVVFDNREKPLSEIKRMILREAVAIHKQDLELCRKMAEFGVKLVKKGDRILTHCNAGSLATGGDGTAVAVIYKAHKVYKDIKVYADETRPLLQGARLTAWELQKNKVPTTLICDSMAAYLMQKGNIDKIFVGADRIASNGDAANKIGTYNLAVIARYHKLPFYVVAPFSTFDLALESGEQIPIEERADNEVRTVLNKLVIAPQDISTANPAFDVTPNKLITAIVTDKGIIYPPFKKNIVKTIKS